MLGHQIDRTAYEFCHHFTSSGECQGMLAKYKGDNANPQAFRDVADAYASYRYEMGLDKE